MVLHNVASLSWLQGITYLLPIIILPYLFRVIGAEKFGLICFAQAFVQYFIILTDYGFSITATKEISLCQHNHAKVCRVFTSVMLVKISLACLSFIIVSALVYTVPKFRQDWPVYLFSFGVVIGTTFFPVWFFQGMEKMKYIADLNIIGEIVLAFLILALVRSPDDFLLVPIIHSSVFLLTGLAAQIIVAYKFGVTFKFGGLSTIRTQLKEGWSVFISIVAINAYTTTRIFAMGLLTTNTTTGLYSIAEKIANVVQTFPLASFSQAVFPRLSKIFHKNKRKAYILMQQIQQITIKLSLISLPIMFLCAPAIVTLVCGREYPEVVKSLQLLLVSVFFICANAFRVQFLLVSGKTHTYSRIHVYTAMVGLPLIIALIHFFPLSGAAMATIAIEGGILIATYVAVRGLKCNGT